MAIPKKAAKKVDPKQASPDDAAKDLRRAFEHLGRVQALHSLVSDATTEEVSTLTHLAQKQLSAGRNKDAADLLRGAEHLSFGGLKESAEAGPIDPKLNDAIGKELHHKLEKAQEHWKVQPGQQSLQKIYEAASDRAKKAFAAHNFRQALELARAAEALAHVKFAEKNELPSGEAQPRLKA